MAQTLKPVAVVYSDLHIEQWKKYNEGNRRTNNALKVIRLVNLEAKKLKVPVLFTGDLYHKEKNITNELMDLTLPTVYELFSGSVITYAITGNHDQSSQNLRDNQSPSYINTLSKICKSLVCVDFKSEIISKGINIHGVPYLTHDIGLVQSIEEIKLGKGKNILMLHTTMPGARDTDNREIDSHLPTKKFYDAISKFDLVLCGHIHKPEEYIVQGTQVIQIGAPQQQRFTDRNCDMGYWVIYEDMSFKFVPMKFPKFVEIDNISDKLNDGNFYVEKPKELKKRNVEIQKKNSFVSTDKTKLASNYCKEKKIKDKSKKKALTNVLKIVE